VDSTRRTALVAGLFYLITFAASIPAVFLLAPVLNHPAYIVSPGADTRVLWGCFLDLVNALACIGTAVALFPVVRRQNEAFALGFVTSRMLEAAIIVIGVISLLAVVTLRQDLAGAPGTDTASLVTTGRALVAVHDWTFPLGPGLMPGINAVLLGYLMYRSGLVPRLIPRAGTHRGPFAHRFGHRCTVPRRSPGPGPGGDRDRPDLRVGSCRLASGWSSRASGRRPSPSAWRSQRLGPSSQNAPCRPQPTAITFTGSGKTFSDRVATSYGSDGRWREWQD
jgi:Domain of unknown function (DUF4386)